MLFFLCLLEFGVDLQYLGILFELFLGSDNLLVYLSGQSTLDFPLRLTGFESIALGILVKLVVIIIGLV